MAENYTMAWDDVENRLEFRVTGPFDRGALARLDSELRGTAARPPRPGWTVLADLSECPPADEEFEAVHRALLSACAAAGMFMAVVVVQPAVLASRMRRLATDVNASSHLTYASSVAQARIFLRSVPAH